MVDYVKISVKAGDGGDGHVSFMRARGRPYGVAEGGDGGLGGDVYILPSPNLNTLTPYRFKKNFDAEKGENGGRNNRTGAKAPDLLLEVPIGTLIKKPDGEVLYDITRPDDKILVAKGGKGGRGNIHLKHMIKERQERGEKGLIKVFEKGSTGESFDFILELKILADVGLVGLPNAGKSTLISTLTAARPKVADYPFTTLEPNLGVLTLLPKKKLGIGATQSKVQEIVLADIPGLIEGASSGRGLGDQFLRHIERTKLLVHLVSLDSKAPFDDYKTINQELSSYSSKLKEKPQLVCLTKSDLVSKEVAEAAEKSFKQKKIKTLTISALSGVGLEELKKELAKRFR